MSFQMQKRTVWTIFCQENKTNKLQVAQESIVFMFQNWPLLRLFWVFGLKANVSRKVCFWVGNLPFRPKTSVFGRKRAFSICDAFVLKLAWKRNVSFTQPNILLLVSKCMFFAEKTYKKKQSLAYIALKDDQRGPLKKHKNMWVSRHKSG